MLELNKKNLNNAICFRFQNQNKSEAGFTLVELMIAMMLSLIVMGSIVTVYVNHQRNTTAQDQVSELQQNLRAALYVMEHEIRMAGYDPLKTGGAAITTAVANNLVFTRVADTDNYDNDGNGTKDEPNELETINFRLIDSLGDGDTELGLQTARGLVQPAVENIDAIEFLYTLNDGTQSLNPVDLSDIQSVTISILARAGRADPEFTNSVGYYPASATLATPPLSPRPPMPSNWDINDAGAGTGNPANDNFRRRLITFTVQCRNMGL